MLAWSYGPALAQEVPAKGQPTVTRDQVLKKMGKMTKAEQEAAAKSLQEQGLLPGKAALPVPGAATKLQPTQKGMALLEPQAMFAPLTGIEGPGGVPHYFGPYGNWAFSPLPKGVIQEIRIDNPGSGYTSSPALTILDAYGTGSGATASATVAGGEITAITVNNGGSGYSAPVVSISGGSGVDGAASAFLNPATVTGGLRKFVDSLPLLGPGGANNLGQYIPVGVADKTSYPGSDYYEIALVEYTERMHSDLPATRLQGYVQLSSPGAPGSVLLTDPDGFPILLPNGQQAQGVTKPHYLGPLLVAKGRAHGVLGDAGKPVPVRVKFYNLLPANDRGDLFLPVDESVMGAGYGPAVGGTFGKYSQNRATIHLHGNNTVWISDGNVHQWITPANENTPYPKGVSVRNVPDMKPSGAVECDNVPAGKNSSGCMTFFYTNAQSARLMFYHDHAMGITRLNVYAGQAAGYLITDQVEKDMIDGTNVSGVNPGNLKVLPDLGIPLIIQDKTFVDKDTVFAQDPTWNWGTGPRDAAGKITAAVTGDLWYPHVYMTVQNPSDSTGTNAFGRWHYGPWFNPPTPECVNGEPVGCIEVGLVPNEYYQPICATNPSDPACTAPWEPPMRPGVPNPSMPGESFLDTPVVNGTAYPYVEVEPKAYRFRVLNASNDRFVNLQLYVAADKTAPTTADTDYTATPARLCEGSITAGFCTEVKMVPVTAAPANQFADTPSGIPDPLTKGPAWIQIGTEGGFMPKPVVVPQQPIGYNLDPAYFSFGLVNQHSLFIGSAERADVIVDFSAYAGKTLILYNDSPAPVPAGAAPYDFYTGNGHQMDGGGAPNTVPGYGPNTRTIMQIRVTKPLTTPTTDVTLANLEAVFAKTATKAGVFETSQEPIIIPQAEFNSAYNNTFPADASQYIKIADISKTFKPIDVDGVLAASPVTLPLQMKAMHDEMGGVYDTAYGRMSGMLGLSLLNSPNHVLVPYGLASPPTDLVRGSLETQPIGVMPDGTQIWRIFHNGVDTHTIHTHLFHAQLVNRVDQSGQVTGGTLPVDPTDLGWKDTFKVNPLEVTYLAMRPTVPTPDLLPFEVPDSVRLIDPTLPEGATLIPPPPAGWFDPNGVNLPEILNHKVNFGWEYVWHCHILSHEEMDMMHTLVFAVPPKAPTGLSATVGGTLTRPRVALAWTDNSLKETQFIIQRATDGSFITGRVDIPYVNPNPAVPNTVNFMDRTVSPNTRYWYRVVAANVVGDTQVYPNSAGFPTMSAESASQVVVVQVGNRVTPNGIPTNLQAVVQAGPRVNLTWTDTSTNETGFAIERCTGAVCTNFAQISLAQANSTSYLDSTVTGGITYNYRIRAVNGTLVTNPSNTAQAVVPALPVTPESLSVTLGANQTANLAWVYPATGPAVTGFTIERATNANFTTGLFTAPAGSADRNLSQAGLAANTTYYYRIRANNASGSSAWKNALPFPIRTGP